MKWLSSIVGHRGIKTDARDARALSEASARVELASVHIPSELSREMKACAGMREVLARCRTQLVNNVRGWLRGRLIRGLTASTANFPRVYEPTSPNRVANSRPTSNVSSIRSMASTNGSRPPTRRSTARRLCSREVSAAMLGSRHGLGSAARTSGAEAVEGCRARSGGGSESVYACGQLNYRVGGGPRISPRCNAPCLSSGDRTPLSIPLSSGRRWLSGRIRSPEQCSEKDLLPGPVETAYSPPCSPTKTPPSEAWYLEIPPSHYFDALESTLRTHREERLTARYRYPLAAPYN